MNQEKERFILILAGLAETIRSNGQQYPKLKERMKEYDLTAQIRLADNSCGRWFSFENGQLDSDEGILDEEEVQVELVFKTAELAEKVMRPDRDHAAYVNGIKYHQIKLLGDDLPATWFEELLITAMEAPIYYGDSYGTDLGNGVRRLVNATTGGALFVYVKDGKIIRTTPIDLSDEDSRGWVINARGKKFTPPRKLTINTHGSGWKALIYSKDRNLYPMKRVDWDPKGERNPQNRGKSPYVRISWDEAYQLVADEIRRVRMEHGPSSVLFQRASHHTWGNIGYFNSALFRFMNLIGATATQHNPDSWEGWVFGAEHHFGHTMKNGMPEPYSTTEDCLKNAEMIVFWSSDPESTSGLYGAYEGTIRREWLKQLGIEIVHIDPYYNHTAAFLAGKWISPRVGTDTALALAIAWVWLQDGTYDKGFVKERTIGFEEWVAYLLGEDDGVPKTPEWQEDITGVPARDVRTLAKRWGSKRTYLAPGGIPGLGSACRSSHGTEWTRAMVCLMAMQGFGKPGVNFGNLQNGAPLDTAFYFPGYSDGGICGDCNNLTTYRDLYNRMPTLYGAPSTMQQIPRLRLPEAIRDDSASWYAHGFRNLQEQFALKKYPLPGHSPCRMFYRYGTSNMGTQPDSHRYARMYNDHNLECVVNQSIWFEGDAKYADIILPACTNFERWDISEIGHCGGYVENNYLHNNYRVFVLQHKCIEPLGESKSDYQIFWDIAKRLGLGKAYSVGSTELDWAKRIFEASDLSGKISWGAFLEKGYYVLPAPPENQRDPVAYNWFYEGRTRDVPEASPLAADYKCKAGKGFQTQSGKFEFACNSLKLFDPDDPDRAVVCKYIPSIEGQENKEQLAKYPLQLTSPHPRYSHHTMMDGKDGVANDIPYHRRYINGHYYWIARLNPMDAKARGLTENQLVEVFNDRGRVICALNVTERIRPGTVHSYEASAVYEPNGQPGSAPETGGCINTLTSKEFNIPRAHAMSVNSCLVDVRAWKGGV
jgi:molybdopterin guanine dinucleotide-containing S/N-oxide reductase-like protein